MSNTIRLAAITDEFSPDLDTALDAMASVGMTGAELRMIGSRNIIDLDDEELDRAREKVEARGMSVVSIASPLLKCVLPEAPPVDTRFQQDAFAARYSFDDQPRLAHRAFEIARRTGAPIIRVFSYWRTVEPERCFDAVVSALSDLAAQAHTHGLVIGLENEHACNVATAAETARVMAAIPHEALGIIWDPANASVSGEVPFPEGWGRLPASRVVHVHTKDCDVHGHVPTWGPVGEMSIDWRGQIRALRQSGYSGWISLETHWPGPGGDKMQASLICGRNLQKLVA